MIYSPVYEQPNKPYKKIDCQSLLKQKGSHSGWLRSQNVLKQWTKKFTVVYKGYVYTFRNETSSEPKCFFSLNGYKSVSEVEDKDNSDFWIFKILHSDQKQTEVFAAPSQTEYYNWLRRFAAEIEWTNAKKHEYTNQSGLLLQGIPHRVQSEIEIDNLYDDVVPQVTGLQQAAPLLLPSSSGNSLALLYDQVSRPTYACSQSSGQNNYPVSRPLPPTPPPLPPKPSKTQTRTLAISSSYPDLSYEHTRTKTPVSIQNLQSKEKQGRKPVFTLQLPPNPSKLKRHQRDTNPQENTVGQTIQQMSSTDEDDSVEGEEEYYNTIEISEDKLQYDEATSDSIRESVVEYDYEECDGIQNVEEENERIRESKTFQAKSYVTENEKENKKFSGSSQTDEENTFDLPEVRNCFIATEEYRAKDDTELDFNEGETFYVIGRLNKRLLIGEKNGKKGLFPAEYLQRISFQSAVTERYATFRKKEEDNYDDLLFDDVYYTDAKSYSNKEIQKPQAAYSAKKKESLYVKIGNISRKCNTSQKLIPQQLREMNKNSVYIYKKCIEVGVERRNKVRIIVVGPKKSGKTCLIRRLLRRGFTGVESTNGVEVHILKCKAKLGDRKWICHEESTIQDDVNSRLLKTIIETTRNSQQTVLKVTDSVNNNINSTEDDNQRISNDNEPLETPNEMGEGEVHASEYNYDEDLRDLGEILKAPFDQEETVQIDLWDFAGDKEYYNTHKAFLSKDAIYLVTFNVSENANEISLEDSRYDLQYWLETIRCYGTSESTNPDTRHHNPPVLIVGTHKDMFKGTDKECHEKLFHEVGKAVENENTRKHVRAYYLVSSTDDTDDSFEDLRSEILEIAQHTRTWNKTVPLKWIHLEKSLFEEISSGQFILSINQIRSLAARTSHPITEHEEIESFLLYHHAIGTYIYFEDLPEYVVLYPQWLANAFKSIVSADMFQIGVSIVKEWEHFRQSGRLSEKLLEHLFLKQSTEIKENKDHILKVMEKFDIIVRPKVMLQSQKVVQESNYFVPCMMRTKDLRNIVTSLTCKSKSSWLCLEFDFLPPPLITCILVTCSREWSVATLPNDLGGHEPIFYRDFALFHRPDYEDEMLLIASFKNVIEIQVWKWGEQKRCYHILRQEIDSLLQRLIRLFQMNISFKTKCKCPLSAFDSFAGMVNIEVMELKTQYICKQHNDLHSTSEMYTDWIAEEVERSLTKEQTNATRLSIITLSVLTDVLYDRLCLDSAPLPPRSQCDVTFLYAKLRRFGQHMPTKGTYGGEFKDIKDVHKKIGDDIERVRLIRNEIQHLASFSMTHDRFMEIRRMCQTIAKRMELHNKKGTAYSDDIRAVLQKDISSRQAEAMETKIMFEKPRLNIKKTFYKSTEGEGCTLECQILVPLPDGATIQWFKGKDDNRTNIKDDPNWETKYSGASMQFPSLNILHCDESDEDFYSSVIKYPQNSAEHDDSAKIEWPTTFLHVRKKNE